MRMKSLLRSRLFAISSITWVVIITPSQNWAQVGAPLQAPKNAAFDPSDVYYQGYRYMLEAEALAQKGKFADASAKYRTAQTFFDTVAKFHPEWKPNMVEYRLKLNAQIIKDLNAKAENELKLKEIAAAELEGGAIRPVTPNNIPKAPEINVNPRIAELEQEIRRLRAAIASPANQVNKDAVRAADMEKQRNEMQARLNSANQEMQKLRQQLAASPLQSELDKINERARSLEMERAAMQQALAKSSERQLKSDATIHSLKADLQAASQQIADLRHHLNLQKNKNNDVVQGQLKQMKQLEEVVKQKELQLTAATNQIASLQRELQQSKDAFAELQTERNTLLRERDELKELLKVSEGDRIAKLIEQNMGLARELREAKERMELASKNSFQSNEQLVEALRDLSIAKAKIREFQTEKRRQDENIRHLEMQLQQERKLLTDGKNTVNQEEADTLRGIVDRRSKQLERTKQAIHWLMEAAKEKAQISESTEYKQALALLDGEEMKLTPEEEKALASRRIDGEIFSPFAGSRDSVNSNLSEMKQKVASYSDVAKRAFTEQRYGTCRDVFQMILDMHPGEIPTMRRLGMVHLRLGEIDAATKVLQSAVENDESQALSHRFYALALYKSGKYSEALDATQRSIDIDPQDSQSYTVLGNILLVREKFLEAENAYHRAISLLPQNHEALHNLAVLYQATKRKKDAMVAYQESLKQGGMTDPALEAITP